MDKSSSEGEKCKHATMWWGIVALVSMFVGCGSYFFGLENGKEQSAFFCDGPERPTITSHTNKKCDYTSGSPVCPEEKVAWWKIECK